MVAIHTCYPFRGELMSKTYEQINEKIRSGKAVVYTAEEVIDLVKKKGAEKAA